MLERQTLNLAKAALLLHTIKADHSRLDLVLELQRFLIRRITQAERRINRVKRAEGNLRRSLRHDRPPREKAKRVKARIKDCADVIESLRYLKFAWRCFGDGIAAVYQSTYTLKHLYYDGNYDVKESAGFLSGKAGFRREWKFVKLGIKMNVPVILADVTNIIRHGDVCALAGEDPMPLEVKSSKNQNARMARQLAELDEVVRFFKKDGADTFRGMPNVRRVALRIPEVNYEAAVNVCIADALRSGFATVEPEAGLRYLAFRVDEAPMDEDRIEPFLSKTSNISVLLPSPNWLPAYPFTLSLNPGSAVRFLLGHVAVLVIIDLAVLKSLFMQHGTHATMLMDGQFAIQFCKDPNDLYAGVFRVSEHRFARVAAEFQSLTWFAHETSLSFDMESPEPITLEEAKKLPGYGWEIPADWYTVKDCFEVPPSENP